MTQTASAHYALPNTKPTSSDLSLSDPFASPFATPLQRPDPCAQPWAGSRRSQDLSVPGQRHDSLIPASQQSSLSSAGSSTVLTAISSIDLEKAALKDEVFVAHASKVHDPEKVPVESRRHSTTRQAKRHRTSPPASEVISLTYPEEDVQDLDKRQLQESKAVRILLFLSGPCVLLSMLNTIWALISIIITALTQPVRLCARRPSFGLQLAGLLGPALNLQLRAIYTPLSPHANEDGSYNVGWLLLVHLLSPFVSFALVFLSWIVAAYWGVSTIVGDPAGIDKRDDGCDSVLCLRNWWESFLLKAVQADFCTPL